MHASNRIASIMIVLFFGMLVLLLGEWFTASVSGRQMLSRHNLAPLPKAPASPPAATGGGSTGRASRRPGDTEASAGRAAVTTTRAEAVAPKTRGAKKASMALVSPAGTAAAVVPDRYTVIIDAGSSGSRVHVYVYRPPPAATGLGPRRGAAPYPVVRLPGKVHRVTPGLSEFAPAGEGVAESLEPLIRFAQQQVPAALHASTPIRLLATAGLRLLPADQREAVLAAVRGRLAACGFAFRSAWVRVLSGDEEGLFAWAGLNYAAGRLQALAREAASSPRRRDPAALAGRAAATTLAVLELGGASMQLTLMPWEPLPRGLGTRLELPGVDRPLYTHSFLGYGLQVAWFREALLVQQGGDNATDPCLHPGYTSDQGGVVGSGSFDACAALAEQLIQQADATPGAGTATGTATTTSGGGGGGNTSNNTTATTRGSSGSGGKKGGGCSYVRCSIGDEYLPLLAPEERYGGYGNAALLDPPPGSGSLSGSGSGYLILATESFYYTLDRLGLPANASMESIRTAGRRFCSRPWSDVERELVVGRGVSEEYVLKVCFGSAYIYTLLQQGFRMGPREATYLRFTNRVERPDGTKVEVNWVLGALLMELTRPPAGDGGAVGDGGGEGREGRRGRNTQPSGRPAAVVTAAVGGTKAEAAGTIRPRVRVVYPSPPPPPAAAAAVTVAAARPQLRQQGGSAAAGLGAAGGKKQLGTAATGAAVDPVADPRVIAVSGKRLMASTEGVVQYDMDTMKMISAAAAGGSAGSPGSAARATQSDPNAVAVAAAFGVAAVFGVVVVLVVGVLLAARRLDGNGRQEASAVSAEAEAEACVKDRRRQELEAAWAAGEGCALGGHGGDGDVAAGCWSRPAADSDDPWVGIDRSSWLLLHAPPPLVPRPMGRSPVPSASAVRLGGR